MALHSGVRVDQRYVLVELLGKGGQGAVWRANDLLDGNAPRALKLIFLADVPPTSVRRALGEAEAMERAAHPGLVPCRRFFRDSDAGLLGLVFDFVHGRSLFDALGDPRMSPEHRRAVLDQLADTLAYVHAHGMVHRDLKSPNILIAEGFWGAPRVAGGVKLVDFGIAAPTGNPRPVTVHGREVGTAAYMAPELFSSHSWAEHTDGFARDVFAFGMLACELFDGAHPTGLAWNAPYRDFEEAYRPLFARPHAWPPPGVGGPFGVLVRACLALDPRSRPASGDALVQLLRFGSGKAAVLSPGPMRAPMTTPHQHATESPRSAAWPAGITSAPSYVPARTRTSGVAEPPARPSRLGPALGIALLVGAAAIGGAALYASCAAPSPVVSVTPAIVPVQPSPVDLPSIEAPLAAPCPDSLASCQSGRACTPGLLKTRISESTWWLRVSGVAGRTGRGLSFGEDMGGTHPSWTVCLQRIDPPSSEVCVPFLNMVKAGGDRAHRLHVTTSDLVRGNIAIRINEAGVDKITGVGAPNPNGLLTSALCGGTHLYIGDSASAPAKVNLFLDER